MSLENFVKKYRTELGVVITIFVVSYAISQWIVDNYYFLEYLFFILLFGLIQEAWSNLDPDDEKIEILRTMGVDSKTWMQIGLLWFIGATVYMSILLRDFVESFIGPLSVIQLLAVIVILSRGFVNVYASKDHSLSSTDNEILTRLTLLEFLRSFFLGGFESSTLFKASTTIWR